MPNILKKRKEILVLLLGQMMYINLHAQDMAEYRRFEFSHTAMGTLFTVSGFCSDPARAAVVAGTAFAMIDSLNLIMSDYHPESELMKLSRQAGTGKWIPVSGSLYEVLRESLYWSKRLNGLFDITVGAYTQLWRRAGRKESLPDAAALESAGKVIGYRHIRLNRKLQAVKLRKTGMQLDLGGIAKGHTVDKIFEHFRKNGIEKVLIDGGGDIRAGESPPGAPGWRIVIMGTEESDSVAIVKNTAIATSGDLYRYTEIDGIRYSHIIDPRTGYGVTVPRTVTVVAPDCTTADVLASFLSVSGHAEGFGYLDEIDGVSAMLIERNDGEKKVYRYPENGRE